MLDIDLTNLTYYNFKYIELKKIELQLLELLISWVSVVEFKRLSLQWFQIFKLEMAHQQPIQYNLFWHKKPFLMHQFWRRNYILIYTTKMCVSIILTAYNRFTGLKNLFVLIRPTPKFWHWQFSKRPEVQ